MPEPTPSRVLIAGGGVAALEALIALRDLGGGRVELTLVAPEDDFTYRPMSVAEPFAQGHVRRYALGDLARDFGARFVRDRVLEVVPEANGVRCENGEKLIYDHLVLAVGAVARPAFRHGISFGQDPTEEALHGLLADVEQGFTRRVAFVVPAGTSWTLPLYEIALMMARQAWSMGIEDVDFVLVSPEDRPLEVFGPEASAAVGGLLASAGIEFVGSAYADVERGCVVVDPSGRRIEVERVVALPGLEGPRLAGVPADAAGFIPVDPHGRVPGLSAVYAAGDGTAFPIKQGGLATQQADAVAETIAAAVGAPVDPEPFRPVLRGLLLTGGQDRYIRRSVAGGQGDGQVADRALWWPPTKIAGRYLAPVLYGRDEAELIERVRGDHLGVELALDSVGSAGRR